MQSNTRERAEAELAEREAQVRAEAGIAAASAEREQLPLDLPHLMEQHPEIQAAITAAVAEATAGILAKLEAQRGVPAAPLSTDRQFAEHLAVSIAALIDQGRPGQQRHVAPEVMAMRENARNAMMTAILAARARGIVPAYRLVAPIYVSEQWVKPIFVGADHRERPEEIDWPGVPNEAMRPLDETSREIYRLFTESIGLIAQPKAADPLVEGFAVRHGSRNAPETGAGDGALHSDSVRLRGHEVPGTVRPPTHILGTIAEPARHVVG